MRDGLGVLLVAVGLSDSVLTRDKLGLVVAFAGVTLLAYGVIRPGGQDEIPSSEQDELMFVSSGRGVEETFRTFAAHGAANANGPA